MNTLKKQVPTECEGPLILFLEMLSYPLQTNRIVRLGKTQKLRNSDKLQF